MTTTKANEGIAFDIEEVLLTYGNGIKECKRLGNLGYSIVATYAHDGEVTAIMAT